jgi:superfamily II DNA/RNA helicase
MYESTTSTTIPISSSLSEHSQPIEEFQSLLSTSMMKILGNQGIISFFPVQCTLIPYLLRNRRMTTSYPGDVCVNAPTGSGKTLAYAIPIIEVSEVSFD